MGGRETMAIMVLVLVLFILFSRKVRSKILISLLLTAGVFAIFIIFQEVFQALFKQTTTDIARGNEYIRIVAIKYYLTDFFKTPWAYFTGNGMYSLETSYGREMSRITSMQYYLGDIGLIGNYVVYGPLFVIGVLGICFKSVFFRIMYRYIYIRYLFIAVLISLITGGGFGNSDFICFIMCIIYMIDISAFLNKEEHLKTLSNP
jgi:hypothetical protein